MRFEVPTQFNEEDAILWWCQLLKLGVPLHPDDSAECIVNTATGDASFFSSDEASVVNATVGKFFDVHGGAVYKLATLAWQAWGVSPAPPECDAEPIFLRHQELLNRLSVSAEHYQRTGEWSAHAT